MIIYWRFEQEGYAIREEEYSFKLGPFSNREIIGVALDAPQWAKDEYQEYVKWKKKQDEILIDLYREELEEEECTIENGLKVLKLGASQDAKEKYKEYSERQRQRKIEHENFLEKLDIDTTELEIETLKIAKFKDITIKDSKFVLKPNASQEAIEAFKQYTEWEKKYFADVTQSNIKLEQEEYKPTVQKKRTDVFAPLFNLFKKLFP